jgi:hypothetical protein
MGKIAQPPAPRENVTPSRRSLLGFAVAGLVAAIAGHVTGATFSAATTNPANTFSAASSFPSTCPTAAAPATEWIGGFESGRIFGGHASTISLGANTANVTADTATVRNGSYSMKVNANGVSTHAARLFNTATSGAAFRFAVLLPSLPGADVELARLGAAPGSTALLFGYKASTQKFTLQFTGGTVAESSAAVTAGQWSVVDMRLDQSTTTWTGDWRVNQVAQTQRTVAGTAGTSLYAMYLGTTLAQTFTAYYDDVALSHTAADYPLGNGKVLILKPASMGTNSGATNFQHEDGTAVGASTYLRLDDVPISGSTDYVKQVTASATSYLELKFEQATDTCIRLVQGIEMNNMGSSNQTNLGKTSIFDGATERVVYSGSMVANVANVEYLHVAAVPPTGTQWTKTELNNLVMRIGYSTDVSPLLRWDALLIEYEVAL